MVTGDNDDDDEDDNDSRWHGLQQWQECDGRRGTKMMATTMAADNDDGGGRQ